MSDRPPLKLPEITYPLVIDTIGKELAVGHRLYAYCLNDGCRHQGYVNLEALAFEHGVDHPNGHDNLLQIVHCRHCRAAGRRDTNLQFTVQPQSLTDSRQKTKR